MLDDSCAVAVEALKRKRYRAEPQEPLGAIRTSAISLNRVATALIGNPVTFSMTTSGLDLIVLPGGPLSADIYAPTGRATISIVTQPFRLLLRPGKYRVSPSRWHHLKGLVFQGALLVEKSWIT